MHDDHDKNASPAATKTMILQTSYAKIVVNLDHRGSGNIQVDLDHEDIENDDPSSNFGAKNEGIERFILALACAGVDITLPAFATAYDSAIDAIVNDD